MLIIANKIQDKTQSNYVIAECDKLNNFLNGMHKFIHEGKVIDKKKQAVCLIKHKFMI